MGAFFARVKTLLASPPDGTTLALEYTIHLLYLNNDSMKRYLLRIEPCAPVDEEGSWRHRTITA